MPIASNVKAQIDRQTYRQTHRHIDRHTQTGRQTHRHYENITLPVYGKVNRMYVYEPVHRIVSNVIFATLTLIFSIVKAN